MLKWVFATIVTIFSCTSLAQLSGLNQSEILDASIKNKQAVTGKVDSVPKNSGIAWHNSHSREIEKCLHNHPFESLKFIEGYIDLTATIQPGKKEALQLDIAPKQESVVEKCLMEALSKLPTELKKGFKRKVVVKYVIYAVAPGSEPE